MANLDSVLTYISRIHAALYRKSYISNKFKLRKKIRYGLLIFTGIP